MLKLTRGVISQMTKDRVKDSETSLYRLRGENADISEETADIKVIQYVLFYNFMAYSNF